MIDSKAIDKLAEFCRLSERGYTRDENGEWLPGQPGLDRYAWRPDQSDDDCRMVLEECRERGQLGRVDNVLFDMWLWQDSEGMREVEFPSWLLIATPAEKCAAVLKVLGASGAAEASDK